MDNIEPQYIGKFGNYADLLREVSGTDEVAKLSEQLAIAGKQKEAAKAIIKWPAKGLKTPAVNVTTGEFIQHPMVTGLSDQISHMKSVMRLLDGVGIAANQLGYKNSVCICWFNAREEKDIVTMVNPNIVQRYGRMLEMREACLSADGCVGVINRHEAVEVAWFDEDGIPRAQRFDGWNARIVQHEVDHLNGVTIVDKFNQADRLFNKNQIEYLELSAGVIPKRLQRKGIRLKHIENGHHKYVQSR